MAIKPTDGHLEWVTDDDPAKYIAPSGAKRLQGWIANEKPPFQYFNWMWRLVDRWLKWAEQSVAELIAAIAGEASARSAADQAHANLTTAHGSTSTPTAGRIMMWGTGGRAKSAAPLASDDVVRKAELDLAPTVVGHVEADNVPTASIVHTLQYGYKYRLNLIVTAGGVYQVQVNDALQPGSVLSVSGVSNYGEAVGGTANGAMVIATGPDKFLFVDIFPAAPGSQKFVWEVHRISLYDGVNPPGVYVSWGDIRMAVNSLQMWGYEGGPWSGRAWLERMPLPLA